MVPYHGDRMIVWWIQSCLSSAEKSVNDIWCVLSIRVFYMYRYTYIHIYMCVCVCVCVCVCIHVCKKDTVYDWCVMEKDASLVDSSWNVKAQGDAREGKWRGNWRMEWAASTLHTTSEHGVSSITTADAHTSAASSRLNWRLRRFKWTRPVRRKTKSGFCECVITFQLATTTKRWQH